MSEKNTAQLEQERREECRRGVRKYLAERQALAFHPRTILRRLTEGHAADFTEDDVRAALAFLVSAGQAEQQYDGLGATPYFKATSQGVIQHERDAL